MVQLTVNSTPALNRHHIHAIYCIGLFVNKNKGNHRSRSRSRLYWPFKTNAPSRSEIFSVIVACSLCLCVLGFEDQHTLPKANTHKQREQATLTKNISLWERVLVFNGQYTRAERTSYNNKKYFTLGGCACLQRPIHMSRENKLQ